MWNGIKYILALLFITAVLTVTASAAEVGDVIGYATGTDIVSYINNYPLPSYNINDRTAVIASDLNSYGFMYHYNNYLRRVDLTFLGDKITPLKFWKDKTTYGQPVSNVLYTDIEVYIDGVKIESFNVDGLTAIYFSDLRQYGTVSYDDSIRSAFLEIPSMGMGEYREVEDRSTAFAELIYEWSAKGYTWHYAMKIPVSLYDSYRAVPRTDLGINNYAAYARDPGDDIYIKALASCFADTARTYGLTDRECIDMVIDFVQSFKYVNDYDAKGMAEYPSFPVETLFEQQGDCEDTAILLACILKEMGYDAVLLAFVDPGSNGAGHMAVGIKDDGTMSGTYYSYGGASYYYVETTGPEWDIGVVPREEQGKNAYIITI